MSDCNDNPSAPAAVAPDPAGAIRALATENLATSERLRTTQIPQHVGMAAASRQLASELPAMLLAHIEAELRTGVLAKRWDEILAAAREGAAGDESAATTVAAIAVLLREQTRAVMRHLTSRGKEWTAEAHRLEGQAGALQAQAERLLRLTGAASPVEASGGGDTTESVEAAA